MAKTLRSEVRWQIGPPYGTDRCVSKVADRRLRGLCPLCIRLRWLTWVKFSAFTSCFWQTTHKQM